MRDEETGLENIRRVIVERNVVTWKADSNSDAWLLWQTQLVAKGQSVAGSSPDDNDDQSRR